MRTRTILICLMAWFCLAVWGYDGAVIAQETCDMNVGCHWEIQWGEAGEYDTLVLHLIEDGQESTRSFPLASTGDCAQSAEPCLSVDEATVGLARKISGTVILLDATVQLYRDDGTLLSSQTLKTETGGTPVEQSYSWFVCATSPTAEAQCTPSRALAVR